MDKTDRQKQEADCRYKMMHIEKSFYNKENVISRATVTTYEERIVQDKKRLSDAESYREGTVGRKVETPLHQFLRTPLIVVGLDYALQRLQ